MDFYQTNVDALLTQMKHAEKQTKLKRRWLMGLPTSKYEDQQKESLKFLQNRCLPESSLREDDVFYETSKTHVEKAFGIPNIESGCHNLQDSLQDLDVPCLNKVCRSLGDISNTGLHLLSKCFTKQHTADKTRWKQKKGIKEYLKRMKKCDGIHHVEECIRLSQVVAHPRFFRKGSAAPFKSSYQSPSADVHSVLGNLKNFSSEVLLSMYRKLKGESGKMLHLESHRSGWNRARLIDRVKRICESRLAELEEGDELPLLIAKAMAVTTLSMKLTPRIEGQNLFDFYQFPPDIVILQNNITKAIWLINEKVRVSELRELQVLLGLNNNLPIKGLRSAVRKLLTVYLFECDDMDVIPKSFIETLSVINRSSRNAPQKCFPKEEINKDVECILGFSAHAKQVMLDLLPDHSYDQDFTDAYMEDLQESGSDESDTDDSFIYGFDRLPNNISHLDVSTEPAEGFGESNFVEENVINSDPTVEYSNTLTNMGVVAEHAGETPEFLHSMKPMSTAVVDADEKLDRSEQSGSSNQYIQVQEACDETSLFAYKCIGHVLKECARFQGLNLDQVDISYLTGGDSSQSPDATKKQAAVGDDVGGMFICQVVEDLFPNISNSVKSKLEEMMSLL